MNYIRQLNEFYYSLDYTPISTNAIIVYEMLLHIANKAGWSNEFKVPNIILIGKTRLSLGALQRARNELLNVGLIIYKKGSNGVDAPKYQIKKLYSDDSSDTNSIPNNEIEVERSDTKYNGTANKIISGIIEVAGQKDDRLTDSQVDSQVDVKPDTLINKTKQNKTIKEKNKKEIASDLSDVLNANVIDSDIKNALTEFIKMRKSNKKPLTARGLELIIKKLDKLTDKKLEKVEILNNSIMNNWQGVFPLSDEQKKALANTNTKICEYEILDSSQEGKYVRPKYD